MRTLILIILAALAAGCARAPSPALRTRIDDSLDRAVAYLLSKQTPDGAWRSEVYGALKDGPTLTPPVIKTLVLGGSSDQVNRALNRGFAYLAACLNADGSINTESGLLEYPVYTASLAVILFSRPEFGQYSNERERWLALLKSHQLTEQLGWTPDDLAYGGWGYSIVPPRKPAPGGPRPPFDSDLSSTLFAIGALRLAGASADDPSIKAARVFVYRCQNFNASDADSDPQFDDGGFFLTPTNVIQNKAGRARTDRHGRPRLASYGSATADGVRALLRCGVPADHPRVLAALRWLERNFTTSTNPGRFEPARESDREAAYYYYCWSLAHAFRMLKLQEIEHAGERIPWAEQLATAIMARQAADGSWTNRFKFMKEDDPLIATVLAAGALANCRDVLWPATP